MIERFDLHNKYAFEQSEKKRTLIETFLEANQMDVKKYQHEGMTFWLLDDSSQLGIPDELAALYLHKQREVQQKGIINNCYFIAEDIAQNGYSTGRIHSSNGTSNFVGWGNHCICFDQIGDRFIAVDYTASSNIDENQGHFNLLGARINSLKYATIARTTI